MSETKKYEAWPEAGDRPALVVCRFNNEQGLRCTEFVAMCESATRDRDADALFIADAFNAKAEADAMSYRIVNTDNFGRDYPNESFTEDGPFETEAEASARADELNVGGETNPRYFKVVKLPYDLQPGFEP